MSAPVHSQVVKGLGPLPTAPPSLPSHALALFSLKGKVASISGSSTGIGYAVAEAYAQAGADVAIWYNSTPADAKAEALSQKYGVRCKAYKCKINDPEAVETTILQQEKDFGTIDIFVANAGIAWSSGLPILETEGHKDWQRIFDVDVNAVYYCAKAVGAIFKKNGKGSLILTASISAHISNVPQSQAPYNAAKAAVLHLGKCLAVEWATFARVNTVSPGYVATELTDFAPRELRNAWVSLVPMGREALPQELVGAYIYLASDASTFVTGTDIIVDGGYTAC